MGTFMFARISLLVSRWPVPKQSCIQGDQYLQYIWLFLLPWVKRLLSSDFFILEIISFYWVICFDMYLFFAGNDFWTELPLLVLCRARSVYERSLDIDHRNITVWLKYAEMEMRYVTLWMFSALYLTTLQFSVALTILIHSFIHSL